MSSNISCLYGRNMTGSICKWFNSASISGFGLPRLGTKKCKFVGIITHSSNLRCIDSAVKVSKTCLRICNDIFLITWEVIGYFVKNVSCRRMKGRPPNNGWSAIFTPASGAFWFQDENILNKPMAESCSWLSALFSRLFIYTNLLTLLKTLVLSMLSHVLHCQLQICNLTASCR